MNAASTPCSARMLSMSSTASGSSIIGQRTTPESPPRRYSSGPSMPQRVARPPPPAPRRPFGGKTMSPINCLATRYGEQCGTSTPEAPASMNILAVAVSCPRKRTRAAMSLRSATVIMPYTTSVLSGACSMSMMMKSQPALARISVVSRVGNLTNMPTSREAGSWSFSRKCDPMCLPPEFFTRQRGAFRQRAKLRPLDLRMDADHVPTLRESAICAGDDVFLANHTRVVLDAPRDQLRMLHHVRLVRDDAWNQDLAFGQLDVLPDHPLVLVPRIRRLDRVRLGIDLQNQVDDVLERN